MEGLAGIDWLLQISTSYLGTRLRLHDGAQLGQIPETTTTTNTASSRPRPANSSAPGGGNRNSSLQRTLIGRFGLVAVGPLKKAGTCEVLDLPSLLIYSPLLITAQPIHLLSAPYWPGPLTSGILRTENPFKQQEFPSLFPVTELSPPGRRHLPLPHHHTRRSHRANCRHTPRQQRHARTCTCTLSTWPTLSRRRL